ncbi:serine hydrolase [Roseivirga sp. E12]|uniref:serine hydrolase domain-containing protein n=1 Tax=Roseivirga sp. E12 TaxID=2819237 RepID=UPI001ABBE5DE|nr:serine hydrolase domain-containing protein [Roseivirga sp. E12]MBO3700752.1 beta-lactamase family protein [Roseivirga sp. E12]
MRCEKLRTSRIIALLVCLSYLQIGYSQSYSKNKQLDLSKYLKHLHDTKGFSGEILIAKNSEILFNEAIGMASIELGVAMEVGNKFNIASITKTFTGALMTMAMTEGLLNKEDKLNSFIKGLPNKFSDISIHQLLTHTSGLPHNEAIPEYWQKKSRLSYTSEQMIKELIQLDLLFKPGEKFSYSSPGYFLLAEVLEKVYKKSFYSILEEKILKSLAMNSTGGANTLEILPDMTNGYHLLPNDSIVRAPYRNYSMVRGAGDLFSTTKNLLKWNNGLFNGTLSSQKELLKMFEMMNENQPYGYGWYVDRTNHTRYYHGGGTWGYSSYNAYYPEEALSIIVLSNVSILPMTVIGEQLEAIVIGESKLETKSIQKGSSSLPIKDYAGAYASKTSEMTLNIFLRDGELYAQLQRNPPFKLTPIGGNEFFGKQIDIALNFQVDNDQVVGLAAERMGRKFEFKKQ